MKNFHPTTGPEAIALATYLIVGLLVFYVTSLSLEALLKRYGPKTPIIGPQLEKIGGTWWGSHAKRVWIDQKDFTDVIFFLIIGPLIGGAMVLAQYRSIPLADIWLFLISYLALASVGLTRWLIFRRDKLNDRFGEAWVKMLDYPYILLCALGLYKLIAAWAPTEQFKSLLEAVSPLIITLGLSVRVAKTTIESFQLHRPPEKRERSLAKMMFNVDTKPPHQI